MTPEFYESEWFKSRPACVQALLREFPIGSQLQMTDGEWWYLLGCNESDMLIVSPIDPVDDYDASIAARQLVCASHYRVDGHHISKVASRQAK